MEDVLFKCSYDLHSRPNSVQPKKDNHWLGIFLASLGRGQGEQAKADGREELGLHSSDTVALRGARVGHGGAALTVAQKLGSS